MQSLLEAQRALRRLLIVRWVAIADLLLLVILLFGSLSHNEKVVEYFGLVDGVVFMALIAIVGGGALRHIWGWWFLIATFITTGPPGALIGEVLIMRKAKAILVASESVMPSVSPDY